MRKLIEITQDYLIRCDNPKCGYFIPNATLEPKDIIEYINMPCPKCGENLLTKNDYLTFKKFISIINWVNKWFSWLRIFSFGAKDKNVKIKIYNGINEIK